jgi:hypothetical protein
MYLSHLHLNEMSSKQRQQTHISLSLEHYCLQCYNLTYRLRPPGHPMVSLFVLVTPAHRNAVPSSHAYT